MISGTYALTTSPPKAVAAQGVVPTFHKYPSTALSTHSPTQRIQWIRYRSADSHGDMAFGFWLEIGCLQDLIPQISRSAVISAFKYLQNNLVTSQATPLSAQRTRIVRRPIKFMRIRPYGRLIQPTVDTQQSLMFILTLLR